MQATAAFTECQVGGQEVFIIAQKGRSDTEALTKNEKLCQGKFGKVVNLRSRHCFYCFFSSFPPKTAMALNIGPFLLR
jgi:hypothetical protein